MRFNRTLGLLFSAALVLAAHLAAVEPDPLRQLFDERRLALKSGEFVRAVEIQRQVVKLQSSNHYQLYYLAELLLQAGDAIGAVEWLDQLYERRVNDLEERLATPGNPFHPLSQTAEFLESDLAKKLAAKQRVFERRQVDFLGRLASLTAKDRPPADYVAQDVCPFECCTYREWDVLEDTELVTAPRSTRVVGKAAKGTQVQGLTGEVHLRPAPVAIVFAKTGYEPKIELPAGDLAFLLDYMGEGYRHVWYQGAVYSLSTSGEVQDHCPFPDSECWGEFLVPEAEQEEHAWWVKVRLPDRTVGWTAEVNFGNIDGCG